MGFWCTLGFHSWVTLKKVPHKIWRTQGNTTLRNIPGLAVLEKCPKCGKFRVFLNDGNGRMETDLEVIRTITKEFEEFLEKK